MNLDLKNHNDHGIWTGEVCCFFPKEILLQNLQAITYTIHVTGIYMYYKKPSIHVGKYTINPIDPSWVMITTNLYGAVFFLRAEV